MRLKQKLSTGFLAMALGLCALGAVWTHRVTAIQARVNRFANLTTPLLVALGQLKAASLDMAVSGYHLLAPAHQEEPVDVERLQELEAKYREWMALFAGAAEKAKQQKLLAVVRQEGEAFHRRWREFLAAQVGGAAADATPARLAEVGAAQRRLQRVLDKAMGIQVEQLKAERASVARSVVLARRLSLAASAAALLLAVGLGLFVAGSIARPIIRLSVDAGIVGGGSLSHRTAVRGRDEIGALAASFNRMTERLEQTTVSKDRLMKAYEELQRAQQQLIQSEKLAALGRFSAGVAHEVKNPLAIILSGVDCLREQAGSSNQEVVASLDIIERSVQRADTIVRDLLKFARPSPLQAEAINPSELVDGTVALLTHSGSLKETALVTRYGHGETRMTVDKNQLQQVLLNLMMNAIDAMPSGGTLTVSTSVADEGEQAMCRIDVADTGTGIAPEHLPKLFEPFYTTKRDKKGTGLGLSISKTIVESHGGTLSLASEVGKGTVVTIAVPINRRGGVG